MKSGNRGMARALGGAIRIAAVTLTALVVLWGAAAIWIDGPAGRPLAGLLVAAFAAAVALPLTRVRPLLHACLVGSRPVRGGRLLVALDSSRATTVTGRPTCRARPPPSVGGTS